YLFNNSLTGSIPESLGNLKNLTELQVEKRALFPCPDRKREETLTATSTKLIVCVICLDNSVLGHNQLSGSIPEALGNLRGLNLIDLERNQLSGPVPNFSNLTNLTNCFVDNLNSMCMPEFLRTIDATRACIGSIRLPVCGGSSNPLPTLVVLSIAAGSIFFTVILSCILLSLNRGKKMPKRSIVISIRESWKKFWSRPSYESSEAEVLRLGVTVILLATLTGYAIFLLHQISTYTPAQSFTLDTSNTAVQIPIIEIKGPSEMLVSECIYQNDFRGALCGSRGAFGYLDDPATNIENTTVDAVLSAILANPFYLANALDRFTTTADSTPEPYLNVSRVQITLTTDSSPNGNDFHSEAIDVLLRHIDAINTNGSDLSQADSITQSSVPILPGYINQVQFATTTRQLLDESQTLACYHLSGIPLKNSTTISPSVGLIGETGDGTRIIIIRPRDFVTEVITDKATYNLLGAIASFLGPLTAAVTVYSWLFGVGKLRPCGVVHELSIQRRMKRLNLLDRIKYVDFEAQPTSSDRKLTVSEEMDLLRRQMLSASEEVALLRRQMFFYLKPTRSSSSGRKQWRIQREGGGSRTNPSNSSIGSVIGNKRSLRNGDAQARNEPRVKSLRCLRREPPLLYAILPPSNNTFNQLHPDPSSATSASISPVRRIDSTGMGLGN
ncbi:hypothetical protein BDK51DRAFT_35195, partial [Blyttiomyces helicus]